MYRKRVTTIFFLQTIFAVYYVQSFLVLPNSPLLNRLKIKSKFGLHDVLFKTPTTAGIPGEPLFLTPYIEAGLIKEGQNASRVPSLLLSDNHNEEGNTTEALESYSGFLTVNKAWNSNLFFWFFPNERKIRNAPVLLWLQGGPGVSSLYGLFTENGPYQMHPDNKTFAKRQYTWTKDFNVLYIDQPVGTGFSFTQSLRGFARNQDDVCRDLYPALKQFFQLFPEYAANDFYITGESYAGKYIPAIAAEIHRRQNNENENGSSKINLKGLLIGNGWSDPENMMVYGDYLYQLGFVDTKTQKKIHEIEHLTRTAIRSKQFANANNYWNGVFDAATNFPLEAIYDYTRLVADPLDDRLMNDLVGSDRVRKAIHVGNFQFDVFNIDAYYSMLDDMMRTVAPLFDDLLRNYRILLYSGQFDVIVAYPLTRSFLQNLHFDGAVEYQKAITKSWRDDSGLVAGHWKTVGNLTEILVRNAGHMVPTDQPKWAYQMVRDFISGNKFT